MDERPLTPPRCDEPAGHPRGLVGLGEALARPAELGVRRQRGRRDLRFGRPIWVRAGSPMDLSEFEETKDEIATLRKVTELIMDELRRMVLEMRAAYPKKWA